MNVIRRLKEFEALTGMFIGGFHVKTGENFGYIGKEVTYIGDVFKLLFVILTAGGNKSIIID